MQKLKYATIFFFISIACHVHAQIVIGIQGGYDINRLSVNTQNLAFTKNETKPGFELSAPVDINFHSCFVLKTGITYISKNHALTRTGPYTGLYQNFKNTYLQLPLLLSYQAGMNKIRPFISAGIYGSYWLSGREDGLIPNIFDVNDGVDENGALKESFGVTHYQQDYQFNHQTDKRLEFGLAAALGTDIAINRDNFFRLQGNLYTSLTSQQKNYMQLPDHRRNSTLAITVGIAHTFPYSK